jgi:uncharacterized protein HemX
MDVMVPPADALATPPVEAETKTQPVKADKRATKPVPQTFKSPKERTGVALAIVATVIIVLGLGLLTVYAYLKQTNSL